MADQLYRERIKQSEETRNRTEQKVQNVCLDRQPSRSNNIVGKDDNSASAPEKAGNKRLRDIAGFGLGST